jgi:hypothetical protein
MPGIVCTEYTRTAIGKRIAAQYSLTRITLSAKRTCPSIESNHTILKQIPVRAVKKVVGPNPASKTFKIISTNFTVVRSVCEAYRTTSVWQEYTAGNFSVKSHRVAVVLVR